MLVAEVNLIIKAKCLFSKLLMDNPGQNIWQKCHITPLLQISMLSAQINMFTRKGLTKYSNIDAGGGTSAPNILYKVHR